MKRTLLVTHSFPPLQGGLETVLYTLARQLGNQVIVLTTPTGDAEHFDKQQPFRIVRVPFFASGHFPSWLPLLGVIATIVRREQVAAVLYGHYGPYAIVGPYLHRRFGIPYDVYCHGLDALSYTRSVLHRQLLRYILRRAGTVFTNSRWTLTQLAPYVAEGQCAVLSPPLPDDSCPPTPVPHNHRLFSVGRLATIKGYDVAIRAVALVRREFPDVHYTLVGGGGESQALERLVTELDVSRQVTLAGPRERRGWCPLIAQSTIVLQPSRRIRHRTFSQEESFGLAALEAAQAGRLTIASRVGGVPEVVRDGETGSLVEPDNPEALAQAIIRVFRNPAELERLSANAQLLAKECTASRFFDRYRELTEPTHFPKVSVCLPAHNAAATLDRTLRSLLDQDYPNLELIVVDDGSTDTTANIASRYPRVRLLRGQHRGASAARNRAAEAAQGELLYFADADCIFSRQTLSTLVHALRNHPDVSFVYSSFRFGWKRFRLQPFDPAALRERNYIPTMALIRRQDFPGFDETLNRLQDWDLWLTLTERGKEGVWIDRVLFRAMTVGRGISGGWFPKFLHRIPALANRLSRGSGLSLVEAEAIVRRKHGLDGSARS